MKIKRRIIVLGHQIEIIKEAVNKIDKETTCVHQKQQLGTGHALQAVSYTHLDVYKRQGLFKFRL